MHYIKAISLKTKTITVLGLIFTLTWLNLYFPVMRFSHWIANNVTFAIILFIPAVILWRSFYLTSWWFKTPIILCLVPIIGFCSLLQLLTVFDLYINREGKDSSFQPARQFLINDSSVVEYTQYVGDNFGMVVRQERRLMPGILLVRELYRENPYGEMPWKRHCNYIELAGNEAIRIVMVEKTENELIIPIKRYIWF